MKKFIKRMITIWSICLALAISAQDNPPGAGRAATQVQQDAATRQKELAAARERLEQAAREVAELSEQGTVKYFFNFNDDAHFGPRKSMLGIVIEGVRDDGNSDGVVITGVSPDGPAEKAGLKTGDQILSFNGESLAGASSSDSRDKLLKKMEAVEPGTKVAVEYIRNGKTARIEIETVPMQPPVVNFTLADREFNTRGPEAGMGWAEAVPFFSEHLARQWGDLELVAITPELGKYFGTEEGVLVVRSPSDGQMKLEDGDVIVSIDGRKPNDPNHALRILRSYAPGESLAIEVMRDKRKQKLEVTVPEHQPDESAFGFMPRTGTMVAPRPPRPPQPPQQIILDRQRGLGI